MERGTLNGMSATVLERCHGMQNALERWGGLKIGEIALILAVHALVLFVGLPAIGAHLSPLYSHDQYIDGYNLIASNLADGNGYRFYQDTAPTLMREPGYPIALAGIFLAFGKSFTAVKIVNMCLTFVTAALVVYLATMLSTHRTASLLAPVIYLFHPGTLIAESRAGVESLFTTLIVLFFVLTLRAMRKDRLRDYLVAGGVLGLAVLVRSTPILFPILLLAYRLTTERREGRSWTIFRNISMLIFAMVVVLSPWIIRNYRLTGRIVPTASVLGISAHAGQFICSHLNEDKPWYLLDREASRLRGEMATNLGYTFKQGEDYYQFFYKTDDEMRFSKYLIAGVVEKYRESPKLCAKCITYNLFNFWFAGKSGASVALNLAVQLPLLLCSIYGVIISAQYGRKVAALVVVFVAYFVAISVPILAQARYSVPLLPFLAALTAAAMAAQWTSGSADSLLQARGEA
jgi:4-amino-4-deoxy-L-arabinose transferase-like glycosyltransferase